MWGRVFEDDGKLVKRKNDTYIDILIEVSEHSFRKTSGFQHVYPAILLVCGWSHHATCRERM